ncbi:MAG: phosphoglycerate mutase [Euryarchaeota archaeon]|nr:phosphoglycerate mutase [Euryarchaeota archaeon]|tara:strand:+ start:2213 stop:2653 length:441 start_codon:yes stop_codon:yes gene_type:complete
MRHAKSSWADSNLNDHDRPLNQRGRKDSPRIYQALLEMDWLPDAVYLSSSKRTCETLSLMNMDDDKVKIEIKPSIYHAPLEELIILLGHIESNQTTMFLGHNPGSELLINHLIGEWHRMPTASAALLVKENKIWKLENILRPKELL